MSEIKREWYENRNAVYFMLFLVFPVGRYGLWKNESFQRQTKTRATLAIVGLVAIYLLFSPAQQEVGAENKATQPSQSTPQESRVVVDLEGRTPPQSIPAAPVKKEVTPAIDQKPARTKDEWRKHIADLEEVLDTIEKRRQRLEGGGIHKNRALLAAWNKETQQWREEITSRVDFARIRLSPCESASFDTSSALSQIVQLGIGYIHPIDGYADKNNLREDYQLARSEISECKKSLTQ